MRDACKARSQKPGPKPDETLLSKVILSRQKMFSGSFGCDVEGVRMMYGYLAKGIQTPMAQGQSI